jgi:hypothetical protein
MAERKPKPDRETTGVVWVYTHVRDKAFDPRCRTLRHAPCPFTQPMWRPTTRLTTHLRVLRDGMAAACRCGADGEWYWVSPEQRGDALTVSLAWRWALGDHAAAVALWEAITGGWYPGVEPFPIVAQGSK